MKLNTDKKYDKILLISIARTASSYLTLILGYPFVHRFRVGEPFNTNGSGYGVDWESMDKVVVKTHVQHLLDSYPDPTELTDKFDYVIKVKRRNLFQQVTSLARSKTMDVWNLDNLGDRTSEEEELMKQGCIIAKEDFVRLYEYVIDQYKDMENIRANDVIYFEDLSFDPKIDIRNICGLPVNDDQYKSYIHTAKLPDKQSTIKNYEECKIWWRELTGEIIQND